MRIERVELFLLRLPLKNPFETSFGVETHRTPILCRIEGGGAVGWSECVAQELPAYSEETVETCWHALADFLIPRVLGAELSGPQDVADHFAGIRRHNMAKATLEMATWDLAAKQRGATLSRLLGGSRDRILSGVSIGLQSSLDALVETVRRERAAGYLRIKLKIKPGMDVQIAERIRRDFPDLDFMLDANSAYTLEDTPLFQRIDATRPMMIEQPLAYDDMIDHATLQRSIRAPICLDESIHSAEDARKAIAIGATRIVNIKPGRVGGHREAKLVHDICAKHDVPVWCGGMLETGIGRAHNVHLASLPNFSLPGDVSASNRYFDTELIAEPFEIASDGTIAVPVKPGIGVTVLEDRVRSLAVRAETWPA
ncbi:MAG: o-succinylbenzoate synthase [Chloroflexi bacterium 13_1_40CM_4_68_4]|nr:MAG: o-succinylbenzoate synthase [Chloroflexi bacterium 13_1_40CM_4_68_4]